MKKRLFYLISLLWMGSMLQGAPLTTPLPVQEFYNTMEKMSNATTYASAYDYREIMKKCFRGTEDSGIPVPNDFHYWGYGENMVTTANQYAHFFYQLSFEKKAVKLSYKVESNQYISEVDLKNYQNQSSSLIQTIVSKTFTDASGQNPMTFSDTLIVEGNEIVVFRNALSKDDGEDLEVLTKLAASYYTSRHYYRAYQIYEKIIKIDPRNANAYYRLGLMTFWRKGCSYSRKEAHKKGLEYANKSKALGFYKADTAIYYMRHYNN